VPRLPGRVFWIWDGDFSGAINLRFVSRHRSATAARIRTCWLRSRAVEEEPRLRPASTRVVVADCTRVRPAAPAHQLRRG
jgi:hypothetical protein